MPRPEQLYGPRQRVTDRKMRLVNLLCQGHRLFSANEVNVMTFNGKRVEDYTDEEFEEAIRPYEERGNTSGISAQETNQ